MKKGNMYRKTKVNAINSNDEQHTFELSIDSISMNFSIQCEI